jgi:predicted histidine transporter YuiF (NhaC family)
MMPVPIKLGLFVVALAAIFAIAYAVGSAVGPISTTDTAPTSNMQSTNPPHGL